jgi:hypothetical protein
VTLLFTHPALIYRIDKGNKASRQITLGMVHARHVRCPVLAARPRTSPSSSSSAVRQVQPTTSSLSGIIDKGNKASRQITLGMVHARHVRDNERVVMPDKLEGFEFLGDPINDPPHPDSQIVWGREIKVPRASGKVGGGRPQPGAGGFCGNPLGS